jgi:uncharacterized protein YbjT (DUF2867 family)
MNAKPVIAVTGAFGYSGRFVAKRLLARGYQVRNLSNSPAPAVSADQPIVTYPLCFASPSDLAASLSGVDALINTYWVRFNHRRFSHAQAVLNTKVLFECASAAQVRRVVHVSITNPERGPTLEYFAGKAQLECALAGSGLGHSIVRPAVLFGHDDILINNIAWFLRHLPVFGVPGDGRYGIRPIHVEDFAELLVAQVAEHDNVTLDAVGPESFTFRKLVETLAEVLRLRRVIVSVPPFVAYLATRVLGVLLGDVILTREEIAGLLANTLAVDGPSTGATRLTDWASENRETLGRRYHSELARRKPR